MTDLSSKVPSIGSDESILTHFGRARRERDLLMICLGLGDGFEIFLQIVLYTVGVIIAVLGFL